MEVSAKKIIGPIPLSTLPIEIYNEFKKKL